MNNKQSLVFRDKFSCVLEEQPLPEPLEEQVLVRNHFTLISPGTELAMYTGTHIGLNDPANTYAKYPFRPGYSALGEVVKSGNSSHGFKEGDAIWCAGPHSTHSLFNPVNFLTLKMKDTSQGYGGLFSRFYSIANTAYLMRHSDPKTVVVLGGGLIGNFTAQIIKYKLDCKVVLVDLSSKRLKMAQDCGLDFTVQADDQSLSNALLPLVPEGKAELVVEATGVPAMVNAALKVIKPGGEVILLGSTRGRVEIDVYEYIHGNNVLVTGAHTNAYGRGLCKDKGKAVTSIQSVQEGFDLIGNGSIQFSPLITDVLKPSQAPRAYELLLREKDDHLGMVIDWR